MKPRVVVDTNVVVAGLRNRGGASHWILRAVHDGLLIPLLSVPLLLEYEEVLKRSALLPHLAPSDVDAFLDFWCARGVEQRIFFDWRPLLQDPDDDMLVELAVAGRADFLITSNLRDLRPATRFGVRVVTPAEFVPILRQS